MLPCTSISSPGARLAVQLVDVLGDDRVEQAAALELDQRVVRAVRALVAQRLEALAVEAPERRGSRRKASMCATSIGFTFSQSPVPGERKSGIPDGTEMPAPVSATTDSPRGSARQPPTPLACSSIQLRAG